MKELSDKKKMTSVMSRENFIWKRNPWIFIIIKGEKFQKLKSWILNKLHSLELLFYRMLGSVPKEMRSIFLLWNKINFKLEEFDFIACQMLYFSEG